MLPMPSDIKTNHIAQLPYLNQPFNLFKIEAEEAGFEIEHLDENNHVITLQVRAPNILMVRTENGIVKKIF